MPLDEAHEALSRLLLNPAWDGVIKTRINLMVKTLYNQIIDPSQNRKDRASDDFIRGQIQALKWVVTFPDEEMNHAVTEILMEAEPPPPPPLFGDQGRTPNE